MLIAFPLFLGVLYTPFPLAWFFMFGAVFFVFLNTGPSNTALANVCLPSVRATAFAMNIFVIHLLGDAAAFPTIGYIGGHTNMHIAFLVVSRNDAPLRSDLARGNEIPRRRIPRPSKLRSRLPNESRNSGDGGTFREVHVVGLSPRERSGRFGGVVTFRQQFAEQMPRVGPIPLQGETSS